jgi:hypothetical protein
MPRIRAMSARTTVRTIALTLLAAGVAGTAACGNLATQRPRGRMASLDQHTYASTAFEPKTVRLVDTRTAEEMWSVDVPVGYKVVVKFYNDVSEGTADFPDIMRWEVVKADRWGALLDNQMPVPDVDARRLEWEIRSGPEYPPSEQPDALDLRPSAGAGG